MAKEIQVGESQVVYDLDAELRIDRGALSQEFCDHAQLFAKWGALTVQARYDHDESKVAYEQVVAEADAEIRDRIERLGDKITEKKVEALIPLEDSVRESKKAMLAAKRSHGLCEVAQRAVEHRLQMLIGLGANYRTEAGIDPSIVADARMSARGKRPLRRG
jgi:hypothetical protein